MNFKLTLIFALLVLPNVLFAENPFITKFGGPYVAIDPSFKREAVQYGQFWMRTMSALGKAALEDKAGFAEFVKGEVEPRLIALKPSTPKEEKVKAAASFVETVFQAHVDPSKFKKDELDAVETFLGSVSPQGEAPSPGDKLGYVLIRYQEFVTGITLEQMKKLQKK